ncbi:serine-threonine kinase [Tokyovirus A1]|uniref:serine-threonine kinase n=1 Tax=Tokyovirus A1 TaxID=1826170 RepID=UPI0007A9774D|nr:serine-threonine kinase [Tokyovirus A1]BAU80032.1 serine/threonine protein kinase [Tokyovirus A1]
MVVDSQIVVATTAARSGPAVGIGGLIEGLQTAIYATNNKTANDRNGVLKTLNLEFLVLDDQQDYLQAVQNLENLFTLPESQLLSVTCLAPMQTAIVQSLPFQPNPPPLFGSFSGDVKLFTPFSKNYLNLRPSFDTEFYVMAQFLTSNIRVSRIAFIAGAGLDGTSLNFTRSIEPFGLRVVAGHVIPDYTVISGPMMDEAVQVITSANPQALVVLLFGPQSAEFIRRCKQVIPSLVFIIETLVMNDTPNELWLTGDSDNVYSLSPFPLLADNNSKLQNEFWRDRNEFFPSWLPAAEQAIEGYVNGRWIISILEKMTGNVTRQNFLDTVFSNPIIKIGEVFFGPLGDDCSGVIGCCNSATRQMYVFKYPSGYGEYATDKPISWKSCNPTTDDFKVPTKMGQTLDFSNSFHSALRLGIPADPGFILLSYDDKNLETFQASNIQELETLDNVPLFVSLPLDRAENVNVPVFGVAPLPSEFRDNFFSVSLSTKEELWGALRLMGDQSFLDPFGSFSDVFSDALTELGKTVGAQVVVVDDAFAQKAQVFAEYPNSKFLFLGCLFPENVTEAASAQGVSLQRVFFSSSIPFHDIQNISLTREFEGSTQAEFWSFVNFKFVERVASLEYTSSKIVSNVLSLSSVDIGGFSIGGFSTSCGSGLECCNKGSRTVFLSNAGREDLGNISVPFCNAKFGTSSSSSSSENVGAIVGGVLGGTFVVVVLCCTLVAVLLVVLLSKREKRQDWDIDISELEISGDIGEGFSGKVCSGSWKGQNVAIKILKSQTTNKKSIQDFRSEAETMANLRHPNVILFMAACTKPPNMCIVMEYMGLGSLYEVLHNELMPSMPPALCVQIATQAAKGMHFLHSSGIAHRDLKSLNLLVNEKWDVKVSDFGMAAFLKDAEAGIGTVLWTAPEILNEEQGCDLQKSDVYSFGIILWEMLTRKNPFEGMNSAAVAVAVIRDKERPEVPENTGEFGDGYIDLMTSCWSQEPDSRPTFLEILSRASGLAASGSSTQKSTSNYSSASSSTQTTKGWYKTPKPEEYVTLALVDIVDAFKFWEEKPENAREIWTQFNTCCREVAEKYGAYENHIQGMGRGEGCLLFVFGSEKAALFCCEETLEKLSQISWPGKCRFGIASGNVLVKRDNPPLLFGDVVVKLKALCEGASPGQISIDRISSTRDLKRLQESERFIEAKEDQKVSGLLSINTSRFVMNFREISLGKQLGMGSFGVVHSATWKGIHIAVKRVINQNMSEDSKLRFREEVALLASFDHKNIATFVGCCFEKPNISLVTVLETPGDLGTLLSLGEKMEWETKRKILSGVCEGLCYLHSKGVVHRDIKSSNILVNDVWEAKISDFGFARLKQENMTMTSVGSTAYMAPEVLSGSRYDEKADVYSFGVLVWEVITKKKPYEGQSPVRVAELAREGKRLSIPNDCPKDIKKLLKKCWEEDPNKRPSMSEVSRYFGEEMEV